MPDQKEVAVNGSETLESRPGRYHNAPFDVAKLQGYVCSNYWNDVMGHTETVDLFMRTWCIGAIAKHLARLGLKDDVNVELKKIENYAHYARTGEWLKDE